MIFLDSHIHIYDIYDKDTLLDSFIKNAKQSSPNAQAYVISIMLRDFQKEVPLSGLKRWKQNATNTLTDGKDTIYFLPARQVATKERIEVLGYFGTTPISDNLPITETISTLQLQGYKPVLAWGIGKWLLNRANIVNQILSDHPEMPIGDSALRPTFWSAPQAYQNRIILAGSDPLPKAGDEKRAGIYGMEIDTPFDPQNLQSTILNAIYSGKSKIVGTRNNLSTFIHTLH